MKRIFGSFGATIIAATMMVVPLAAQEYPVRPVTIVAPFGTGGSTDITARILAAELTQMFGQQVLVENKPGAGGAIGIEYLTRSAPDGYTLALSGVGPTVIFKLINPSLPYDPTEDMEPIVAMITVDWVLVARPGLGVTSLPELIELIRANPGTISAGNVGVNSPVHMGMAYLAHLEELDIRHVPYGGDGAMVQGLRSGEVDIGYLTMAGARPLMDSGDFAILGVASEERSPLLPDVPTVAEAIGKPSYSGYSWTVLVAPKGTSASIIDKVNVAVNAVFAKPEVKEQMDNVGLRILGGDVAAALRFIESETEKYIEIVGTMDIQPQ